MPNDPEWARESQFSNAEMWERRAKRELDRACEAEVKLEAAEKRIRELERNVILAVGVHPETAARAFAEHQWKGEEVTDLTIQWDPDMSGFKVRCYVGGTSMKINGHGFPGGFAVTGWV
jgi:hypothetical protein